MSASDTAGFQHALPRDDIEKEYLSDIIRLPGFWPADESCEILKPTGFCTTGHVQLGGKEPCGTRTCPHHWYQWRRRAAINLVARLAAYRYSRGGPTDRGRRLVHLVNGPPLDQRWTTERFWKQRPESYDRAAEVGARGGVAIPHTYRSSDEGNELFAQVIAEGYIEPEHGKWRFLREASETWDDMRPLIEVAPHVHHLAAAEDIDGAAVDELEAESGWMTKNIRSMAPFFVDEDEVPAWALVGDGGRIERTREEVAREGYEDMARLSLYLLSHAPVQPKTGEKPQRQTVTYWGGVHAIDPEEEIPAEVWATIQRRAAAAVGGEVPDEEEGDELGRECSREGCEAPVEPLGRLVDYLSDVGEFEGWFEGLDYDQQCEIWGLRVYSNDRPPPGTGPPTDEARTLPPGGFNRRPSVATHEKNGDLCEEQPAEATTEADFIEWLRRLGRSRIHQATVLLPDGPAAAPGAD